MMRLKHFTFESWKIRFEFAISSVVLFTLYLEKNLRSYVGIFMCNI